MRSLKKYEVIHALFRIIHRIEHETNKQRTHDGIIKFVCESLSVSLYHVVV